MGNKTNKLCFVGQTWPDRLGQRLCLKFQVEYGAIDEPAEF